MTVERLFAWAAEQSLAGWCVQSLLGNLGAALASILACWAVARLFHGERIFAQAQPLTRWDIALSCSAILLNSIVAIIGWILWKSGWVSTPASGSIRTFLDTVLLIFVMDFAMYVLHWVAHRPWIFRLVHRSHHVHEATNPLSLFVLNPAEVLGFGFLMVGVLMLYPFSQGAVVAYVVFNLAFGTMGHLGVEPLPRWLRGLAFFRSLGTSTFHGLHHADLTHNFGFYTTIWDRLFKTLHPEYDARFNPVHGREREAQV